ncbi:BTAD domain-containing putative transcriptional regulator [Gordonia soli]|uniref:Putative transcriptional regulator n=1 Tax=Gordonia soli NBRC 108243 TaxID=1223545 RepID=M0QCZ3_9ACTN|nr:BTAD domain-containing putative transcriptional regulator [Gordonia soli]GAC66478.1 putative transcriptional regulator [Gordonia soli NBRC 108243]
MTGEPIVPIRVLGPLTVTGDDGTSIAVPARKHAELLAILTVERTVRSAEHIADLLWRGHPPASAAVTLQGYVSRLRKTLATIRGVRIDTEAGGYVLRCGDAGTDLDVLDRLGQQGLTAIRAGDTAGGARLLDEALALWRSDPLPEIADITALAPDLARLADLRADLTESAAEAWLSAGDPRRSAVLLSALCQVHPYREAAARGWALAARASGRPAEALEILRDLRRRLADDLGLDPEPRTVELEATLLDPGPPVSPTPIRIPESRLVGRRRELALLAAARHRGASTMSGVVVTGPSGIGKTALIDEAVANGVPPARAVGRSSGGTRPFDLIVELFGAGVLGADALTGPDEADAPPTPVLVERVIAEVSARRAIHGRVELIIDDAQWVDADSVRVLVAALTALRSQPVTIVVISRDITSPTTRDLRDGLRRSTDLTELVVGPLDVEASTAVVRGRLAGSDREAFHVGRPDDVDAVAIAEASGGNPMLAIHLGDAAILGDGSVIDGQQGVGADGPIRALVADRLADLGPNARETALMIAVCGGRVDSDVVAELGAATEIETLRVAGLVTGPSRTTQNGSGVDATGFVHDSTVDAILALHGTADRRRAHVRVADALAQARPNELAAIAIHLSEAADTAELATRASAACWSAARSALGVNAFQSAADLARRGIAHASDDADNLLALYRIAGVAAARLGDFETAETSFGRAAQLSRDLEDWNGLAETALSSTPHGVAGYWSGLGVIQSGSTTTAVDALTHIASLDESTAARLQAGEAARRTVLGLPGANEMLYAAQSRSGPGAASWWDVRAAEFLCRWTPGQVPDRRKIAGELHELAGGDVARQATALHLARVCALEAGDIRMARRTSIEFARLITAHRDTDLETMQLWWQVMWALLRGEYDLSRSLTDRFAASMGDLTPRARLLGDASVATGRSIELWHRGRLAGMVDQFDTLAADLDEDFGLVIAMATAEAGDHDRALRSVVEMLADVDTWEGSRIVARVPLLVETLYLVHDAGGTNAAAAREQCARLERFQQDWTTGMIVQWPGLVCLGPASLYRGTAGIILGRDGADDDLARAVQLARDTGARPYEDRAARRLARR